MNRNKAKSILLVMALILTLLTGPGQGTTDNSFTPEQLKDNDSGFIPGRQEDYEQPLLFQISKDDPAVAYVLVSEPEPIGLLPLPTEGEYTHTLRVLQPDGSEWVNLVHITTEGFWMEESNCEGHDCVDEGMVSLQNRDERILGNAVICLPHLLMLELLTKDEAEKLFPENN